MNSPYDHGYDDHADYNYEVETYTIVRFKFKGRNEIVKTGVTLEEAQEWCNREDTHGEGWFDGFRRE